MVAWGSLVVLGGLTGELEGQTGERAGQNHLEETFLLGDVLLHYVRVADGVNLIE
jgi:hypothetical protein